MVYNEPPEFNKKRIGEMDLNLCKSNGHQCKYNPLGNTFNISPYMVAYGNAHIKLDQTGFRM